MNEIAERTRPYDLFRDSDALTINSRAAKTKFGLYVTAGQALEHLETGIEASPEGSAGKRVEWIVAGLAHHIGTGTQRHHGRMVHFIKMVEH